MRLWLSGALSRLAEQFILITTHAYFRPISADVGASSFLRDSNLCGVHDGPRVADGEVELCVFEYSFDCFCCDVYTGSMCDRRLGSSALVR
jgi:hypothetical protein